MKKAVIYFQGCICFTLCFWENLLPDEKYIMVFLFM